MENVAPQNQTELTQEVIFPLHFQKQFKLPFKLKHSIHTIALGKPAYFAVKEESFLLRIHVFTQVLDMARVQSSSLYKVDGFDRYLQGLAKFIREDFLRQCKTMNYTMNVLGVWDYFLDTPSKP